MKLQIKRDLLEYITNHNDGSAAASELIKTLNKELGYADCDVFSICPDDLENHPMSDAIRDVLGKKEKDPFTMEDCERIADRMADFVSEDFGENLENVIIYW